MASLTVYLVKSDRSSRSRRLLGLYLRRTALVAVLAAIAGGAFFVGWHGTRLLSHSGKRLAAHFSHPTCDVLVIGGTPSGIAAALAAARRGARVVLVEEKPKLGGDIVYAMLNMFDVPLKTSKSAKTPVENGIFGEFYRGLGVGFDIKQAEHMFETALAGEPTLRILRSTRVKNVVIQNKRLIGATLRLPNGKDETVTAAAVVDATNDAQIAARAGAGYYIGREVANVDKKMQSAGLLFSVDNVNWSKVRDYVHQKKTVSLADLKKFKHGAAGSIDVHIEGKSALLRLGGTSGNYAWERGDVVKDYMPRGPDIVVLSLNMGRQADRSVVINSVNIVGVNGLSAESCRKAHDEAARELVPYLEYLRHHMPGFEKAKLHEIAPQLYIRETRHIHGYYALKVADVKADRAFYDRIALCSYPLDLHPYKKGDQNPFGPQRFLYTLPLRCLVPRKIDGLFVASRSLSATYSAAGSARVIPVTMAAGQAAGEAAVLCAQQEFSPQDMVNFPKYTALLQDRLRADGLDIGDRLVKGIKNKQVVKLAN